MPNCLVVTRFFSPQSRLLIYSFKLPPCLCASYTRGNVSWIYSARLVFESSFEGYSESSFFLIPERTVTLHRTLRIDVWFFFSPAPFWFWLSTCTLYVCDNCTQVSMLWRCFLFPSLWVPQCPQIVFFLNTKYNAMFIPYLLYKKTTATRWCTFCLRYCTWERFVSNGWFPSSLDQCRHTNTNLALWCKKGQIADW